jgi:hypothetical protein
LAVTKKVYRRVTQLIASVEDGSAGAPEDASAELYAGAVESPRTAPKEPTILKVLSRRCALVDGFSVHANVHIAHARRAGLEILCRYGARPPLASSRLSALPDGRLLYCLKKAHAGSAVHLVFSPVDFLAKLAAIVPPPRIHLVRFHGVFAPNAKERPLVVPVAPVERERKGDTPRKGEPVRERRIDWATLFQRVFAVDLLSSKQCGGRMKIIAFITDTTVTRRILDYLGLPSSAQPVRPARDPPEPEFVVAGGGYNVVDLASDDPV